MGVESPRLPAIYLPQEEVETETSPRRPIWRMQPTDQASVAEVSRHFNVGAHAARETTVVLSIDETSDGALTAVLAEDDDHHHFDREEVLHLMTKSCTSTRFQQSLG